MSDQIDQAAEPMRWGPALSDDDTEVLREWIEPSAYGGDSDWRVYVAVYVFPDDMTVFPYEDEAVTFAAGTYVRVVEGKREQAWQVDDQDAATAYAEAVEAAYQAEN